MLAQNLLVTDLSTEGEGIARHEDKVIFIKGAVPGDRIDCEFRSAGKRTFKGKVVRLLKASEGRQEPPCSHFGTCGGCRLQHLDYEWQLRYKEKHVRDCMSRIAGMNDDSIILPILPSPLPLHYRNRLDFAFSNRRWLEQPGQDANPSALGFHYPDLFDKVVDIRSCLLMDPWQDEIRNALRKFCLENRVSFYDHKAHCGSMRGQLLRSTLKGEHLCMVMFGDEDEEVRNKVMSFLAGEFPLLDSLLYVVNTKRNDTFYDLEVKCHKGKDHITENLEGIEMKISAKSFFQTNPRQALNLYRIAREYAGLGGTENVYDLYTGTGSIALFLSSQCARITGVESVEQVVRDAGVNAAINGIQNAFFLAGDMRKTLDSGFISKYGKPDVIISDPPRAGMDESVCRFINGSGAKKLVYVSCNPSTQARDLRILFEQYRLIRLQPVDMFPQTMHVETVALLERIS